MDYDDIVNLNLNNGDPIKFDLSGGWTSFEEITGTFLDVSKTCFKYNMSCEIFRKPIEKIDNLVKITETPE